MWDPFIKAGGGNHVKGQEHLGCPRVENLLLGAEAAEVVKLRVGDVDFARDSMGGGLDKLLGLQLIFISSLARGRFRKNGEWLMLCLYLSSARSS